MAALWCLAVTMIVMTGAYAAIPIEQVGQWGGGCEAVAVSGDRAYLQVGPRLIVLDISDPSNPAELGKTPALPDFLVAVAVSGSYAYVVDWSGSLHVIDVSHPDRAVVVGTCGARGPGHGIAVSGDYAYVAVGEAGLDVVDISDPSNPECVGDLDTSGRVYGVAVLDGYAYLAAGSAGLQVIDISDPRNPQLAGSFATGGIKGRSRAR